MSITRKEVEELMKIDADGATGTARALRLTDEEFAGICELLEGPMPDAARELLAREPVWVQETTPAQPPERPAGRGRAACASVGDDTRRREAGEAAAGAPEAAEMREAVLRGREDFASGRYVTGIDAARAEVARRRAR